MSKRYIPMVTSQDWGYDKMQKVKPGDKVQIKAETWNAFIDAANFARSMRDSQGGKGVRSGLSDGVILIKNTEESSMPRYAAMVLTDIVISPESNEDEFVSRPPVFVGKRMTDKYKDKSYAILMEPIGEGKIGRAIILGITPAYIYVNDDSHQYVTPFMDSEEGNMQSSETGSAKILWKGGVRGWYWALLQIGGAGGGGATKQEECIAMCRVDSGTAQGGFSVAAYDASRNQYLSSGILYVPDMALGSEIPTGTWIIGHKCQLATTGGNEK